MIWKDRIKQYPHRYTLTNVSGSTYDFTEVTGEVNEVGTPVNAENMNKLLQRDGDDIKDTVTTFSEAGTRANIATGEKTSTIFGKIKKWFTDLKTHAFSNPSTTLNSGTTSVPSDKLLNDTAELKIDKTNISTVMPLSSAAASNEKVMSEKLSYDQMALKAPLANPTFTGTVTVPTPSNNTDATTKGYVDNQLALKAPLANPTFTGTVTVPTPNNSTDAANKAYVDSIGEAITIGIEATDLNTLIEDGGKWRATTTALAANCINKPDTSPNGFVLECVEMRRSDTPYRTKMQTYRSNNGTWYRIGAQATSADAVTWGDWSNIIVSTGAQTIGGAKTFTDNITVSRAVPEILLKSTTDVYNVTAPFLPTGLKCTDKNGVYTGAFRTFRSGDGSTSVNMTARNQANATMTVGLRGFTDGTWALLQGDTPGVVDIGSNSLRFKDLYLAGNINAAGTITGNVVNSPYKLIASGTLAAGASLTLNNIIQNDDYAGRPLYMRIWGDSSNGTGSFGLNSNSGTRYTQYPLHPADNSSEPVTLPVFLGAAPVYELAKLISSDWVHIHYISRITGTTHIHSLIAQQTRAFINVVEVDDADIFTVTQKIVLANQTTMPTIAFTAANAVVNYAIYTANY